EQDSACFQRNVITIPTNVTNGEWHTAEGHDRSFWQTVECSNNWVRPIYSNQRKYLIAEWCKSN
ncbi:MAG: hypothetical protein ACJ8C4_18120, partial [Gemmataceae bacterium]